MMTSRATQELEDTGFQKPKTKCLGNESAEPI